MRARSSINFSSIGKAQNRQRAFVTMLGIALLAFEVFNYSSTQFALTDMLGTLTIGPIRWATLLAVAFCLIDFAGIARIFTPEQGAGEPKYVWYLFGAWALAAFFNAALTWWGVKSAIMTNGHSSVVVAQNFVVNLVPIFVAGLILLIRVLLINTFSANVDAQRTQTVAPRATTQTQPITNPALYQGIPRAGAPNPYDGSTYHSVRSEQKK